MAREIYLGYKEDGAREIFKSPTTPTAETHGDTYRGVVGPFRTIRGAKAMLWFGYGNPHLRTVSDAERIGLEYANELIDKGKVRERNY